MTTVTSSQPVDLTTEREMAAARRRLKQRERMARAVLSQCRPGAPLHELAQALEDGWPGTPPIEATKIAMIAERIRSEEREAVRRIPVDQYLQEHDMPTKTMQEKVEAATRAELGKVADPSTITRATREAMYQEVVRQTGTRVKRRSWETMYLYPIRKRQKGNTQGAPAKAPAPEPAIIPRPIPELGNEQDREDVATVSTRNGEWYRVGRDGASLEAFGHDGRWELHVHIDRLTTAEVMQITQLVQPMILDFGT
jgi:hypothetical protein